MSEEEFFYCVILEENGLIMLNQNTHTYKYGEPGQVHLAYVVSVIDYNISLFQTVSRSNYAIIDYTMLQSASIVIFRNDFIQ